MPIQEDVIDLHDDANKEIDNTSDDVLKDINSTNSEVIGIILLMLDSFTRNLNKTNDIKYESLRGKITRARRVGIIAGEETFQSSMQGITKKEAKALQDLLNSPTLKPDLKKIYNHGSFSGLKYQEWWTKMSDADVNRLVQTVRFGVSQGQTQSEIIANVKRNFKTTNNGAKMLVRTVGNGVINEARVDMFIQAGIELVEYTAILDGGTSDICRNLDGKIAPPNEIEVPPLHPNCRSTLVPVIDEE